ncbi:MAG: tRNA (adenosine(37)-N6)-threonylcarbamoyltransferase complex ATPase subunit type 1 TsaE, partial [SAR324 cluster bacterium]|nr:tRNA (adenosine(37)-N6)-threonylcarbamoyltransferase complex ATPase subunit type 1 TsaE [SAR324 cluster bacterium]
SPTYTFAHLYPGKLNVSHVDLFRIERSEELDDFDREDLICDDGVTLVEWPTFLENLLNHDPVLKLKFNITETDCRSIMMISNHPFYRPLFEEGIFSGISSNCTVVETP